MRFVVLSTPPSFSLMVTCQYHPVRPCRQASSAGSPHRQVPLCQPLDLLPPQLRTGRQRLGGPCSYRFRCSHCCFLGRLLDEKAWQLQE